MSGYIWSLSLHPDSFEDVEALQKYAYAVLSKCIGRKDFPHLLFSGPSGCGKFTTAKLFAEKILSNPRNIVVVDAAEPITKEERKLADRLSFVSSTSLMRSAGKKKTISPFLQLRVLQHITSRPLGDDPFRILIVKHFDNLGIEQEGFRRIMETYYSTCRMILTTSNMSRIIDPIISRTRIVMFDRVPWNKFDAMVTRIFDENNVESDRDTRRYIYDFVRGNMKRALDIYQYMYETYGKVTSDVSEKAIADLKIGNFRINVMLIYHHITTESVDQAIKAVENLIKSYYFTWSEFISALSSVIWEMADPLIHDNLIKRLAELDRENKDHMDIRPNLYNVVYELLNVIKSIYKT